jgi:hypothetical protein
MVRTWKRRVESGVLLLAVIGLAGCVGNPVAPVVATSSGDPAPVAASPEPLVLTVSADGVGGLADLPPDSLVDTQVTLLEEVPIDAVASVVPGALLARQDINGAVGGKIRCGRFLLEFAPGAFVGTATIQMTAPDSTLMLCDLSISPARLNHFGAPVVLTLDARNPDVNVGTLTIYWFDPVTRLWVDMRSRRDGTAGQLSLQLTHFSRYAGGKAGW